MVRAVVPDAHHRLKLAPRLTDVTGKPVEGGMEREFVAPEFSVTTDFGEREHLNRPTADRTRLPYEVKLTDGRDVYSRSGIRTRDFGRGHPIERR